MLFLALACTNPDRGDIETAELYAVGDSILEWHLGDGSIPEVMAETLGLPMYNAAVSGSHFLDGEGEAIPEQFTAGSWQWLLVDGGGNDVNDRCECGDCDDVLDAIISADGSAGALPDFAGEVAASGTEVLIMGYYGLPDGAEFGFDRCGEELEALSLRQSALAASSDRIHFADAREVADGTDEAMYDSDLVHPSIEGSAAVGRFLAEFIQGQ